MINNISFREQGKGVKQLKNGVSGLVDGHNDDTPSILDKTAGIKKAIVLASILHFGLLIILSILSYVDFFSCL